MRAFLSFAVLALASKALFSADIPGGLARTADALANNTYEVTLAPAYTLKPAGAYLSSEIRYQASDDFGAGFGFGAGEVGFNFGLNGTWFISPDIDSQPGFSLLGGLYLNRVNKDHYFALRVSPTISKAIRQYWGKITPYAGVQLTPSFKLGDADNQFSVRASVGAQYDIKSLQGLSLFTEIGLAIANSNSEIVVGIAYPFKAL